MLRRFLPAMLLLCLSAGAAHAQRLPGDTIEVLSLRFDGNDRFPDAVLRSAIMTARTQCASAALQPFCWFGVSLDRHFLDARALIADELRLRIFYHQRGYRAARIAVDTARVPGGVHITFGIDEGEPIIVQSISIEGLDGIDGAVTRNVPLRQGRPFSIPDVEATRDSILTRLKNRGYLRADALANYEVQTQARLADVEFEVLTGPLTRFGAIEVSGTSRVSPAVVERMLYFREGDLYSWQAELRSQRNLFGLEVFRHAEIMVTPPADGDSVAPVQVRVLEGDLHRVRLGLGASTTDYLSADGRWISRNFLGGGRRLEVRGRVANIVSEQLESLPFVPFDDCTGIYCDLAGSVNADFSQPWFFGPRNALGAGLFLERFSLPGVYVRTSRGVYASLRRTVLGNGVATAAYRPELTKLESDGDLIFCVNFVVCEERDIDLLRDPHWLSPLALSFARDRSNSLFAPTRGHVLRFDAEYADRFTGSDFAYTRLIGELSKYHDPFRGVVFATRARAGLARSVGEPGSGLGLHPQKRFFAGGPNSVRGFAQYRLGPKLLTVNAAGTLAQPADAEHQGAGCMAQQINTGTCDVTDLARNYPGTLDVQPVGGAALLEGNLEVRFPLAADLRAAAFIDVGQVWRDHHAIRLGELQWTPGFGIRYFSPIGPLRVDIGYNTGGAERLAVITTEVCDRRMIPCGDIQPDAEYAPEHLANRRKLRALEPVEWRPNTTFLKRLQFHFSIGQAF